MTVGEPLCCVEADEDDDDFYDAVDDDEKFTLKSSMFISDTTSHKLVLFMKYAIVISLACIVGMFRVGSVPHFKFLVWLPR